MSSFCKKNKNVSVCVFGVVFGNWYEFGFIIIINIDESNSRTLEVYFVLFVLVYDISK
jgi:hypothetical protein